MDLHSLPRWLGWSWLVGGVVTVVAALVGAVGGWLFIGATTEAASDSIAVTRRVLTSVADTTQVVEDVFDDVGSSLRDLQGTLGESSLTLTRASVVTRDLGEVVSEQVPGSIDAVRASLPALIDGAGVVDTTMRGLAFFGVDYDPEVPLDESLEEIDARLEELPTILRDQQEALDAIASDLGRFASATLEMSDDLGAIRSRLANADTVLGDYGMIVGDSDTLLRDLEDDLVGTARLLRGLVVVTALGVAVTQTAPIALGATVLAARRKGDVVPD